MRRRPLQTKLECLSRYLLWSVFAWSLAGCSESKSSLNQAVLDTVEQCTLMADDCDRNATCTEVAGGFTCQCNVGFEGDGHRCERTSVLVDECSLGRASCPANATCVDTQDSYQCMCNEGFVDEGEHCKSSGPSCAELSCDPNADCDDSRLAKCVCKSGFAGDGLRCAAIDRCSSLSCGDNGVCGTSGPTAMCSCDSGYAWDGRTCADVDECRLEQDDCHADAICTNVPGKFHCACKPGYVGNGKQCLPSDPCAPDAAKCGPHSTCTSTPASGPVCVCDPGYERRGDQCSEIHACEGNPCDERGDAGAVCTEKVPTTEYSCTCSPGYESSTGATPVCRNINECRNNPCDNNGDSGATCAELGPGQGYACACSAGSQSSGGSTPSCLNIDDCKDSPCDNQGDSGARCAEHQNRPGYACTCSMPAFESSGGDRPVCRDVDECASYPCARAGDNMASCKENEPGPGYSCTCSSEFEANDGSCVPKARCEGNPCDNNGDAGATCKDNDPPPGYSCMCTPAFRPARGSCVAIQDCADNPCDSEGDTGATCRENDPNPGHSCTCTAAFQTIDGTCKPIVDCQDNPCDEQGDAAASCHENDPNPGYTCDCSDDFESDSSEDPVCKRRDACAIGGNANCVTSASGNTCSNAAPPNNGYTCACNNAAYVAGPDNTSCVTQVDQCLQGSTNDCKPQQRCENRQDAVGQPGYVCTTVLGMWVSNGIQLYDARVPIPTGSPLAISGTGIDSNAIVHSLAVHPSTGQLWGLISSSNGGPTWLAALNISFDGSGVPNGVSAGNVVNVSADLRALTFDESGTLWAVENRNLDNTGLPRPPAIPGAPAQQSRLYTVNTGNGQLSFKKALEAPTFPGDTPSSARCPNSNWKYANARFMSDRETLVYGWGTGKLYRFVGKKLQSIATSDLAVSDIPMSFASDVPGGEPRTIWAAIWNWPDYGKIGFTSPNAVYCDSNIGEYVFTIDLSGRVERAFTENKTLLVRSLGLVTKDLGAPFKAMLPSVDTCRGPQDGPCDGGAYCSGLAICSNFGDASCGATGDCSTIECRNSTSCGGGL